MIALRLKIKWITFSMLLISTVAIADNGKVCAPLPALKNLERLISDKPWLKFAGKPSEASVNYVWIERIAVRGMEINGTSRDCGCSQILDAAADLELSAIAVANKTSDLQARYLDNISEKVKPIRSAVDSCSNVIKI
jgi:hypothetical protein